MNIKKHVSAAIGLAAIASMALALPAFAETEVNVGVNANVNASVQGHENENDNDSDNGSGPSVTGMMNRYRGMGEGGGLGLATRMGVTGTVMAVNGNVITLSGRQGFYGSATTTFTVDAANAKIMKNNATSTVSAVAVGDMLFVQGTISGSNVTAAAIFDGAFMMRGKGYQNGNEDWYGSSTSAIQGNGQPVVAGTVSAVNGNALTITNKSNVQYTVDATNSKIVHGETAILVSDVHVGDSVIVQGTVNGTSITASTVIDQSAQASSDNGKHLGFFAGIGQFFMHLFGF